MLRLEHLFGQIAHHRADRSSWGLRATIASLIDLLSLFSRNDLKSEITRELNEKHQNLAPLRDRPGVDSTLLDATLLELERTCASIQNRSSQITSQALKESEFLLSIINRSAIPGGTSQIDLPGYHRWLEDTSACNLTDLDTWLKHIQVFEDATALYLRMLRQSSGWKNMSPDEGMYVHASQDKFHLIRLAVPAEAQIYPEISAGRQRFTVRFMHQASAQQRETPVHTNCDFRLSLCSL